MTGEMKYVPSILLEELSDIKRDQGIVGFESDSRAMKKMVEYSRVGREVEKIMNGMTLNFNWRKK